MGKTYFNDPRAANPVADLDGDGHSNYAEFIAGSNPLDAGSVFKMVGLQATIQSNETRVIIRWASFEGMTYSIWSATFVGVGVLGGGEYCCDTPVNTFSGTFGITNGFFRLGVAR